MLNNGGGPIGQKASPDIKGPPPPPHKQSAYNSTKHIQPSIDQVYSLSEKVGELKNWKGIFLIALTAIGSSLITWFLKR